jgi:hypothetical protein
MPNYTYYTDIPFATNNPSNDQPLMQQNTDAINNLIGEDHFSFNNNNGGLHQKTRLVNQSGLPSGIASGMGTVYTKTVATSASTNESSLFYVPDGTSNQYQLTRTIAPSGSLFGTNTNYTGDQTGGWTFLPGGLLLQYGRIANLAKPISVTFPISFTSDVFSITSTINQTSNLSPIGVDSVSITGFTIITAGTVPPFLFWIAIGV